MIKLKERGYQPARVLLISSKGSDYIGVEIRWPLLGGHAEARKVKEMLGDEYLVDFLPNSDEIFIRRREDNKSYQ